jgi:hypothetical protein
MVLDVEDFLMIGWPIFLGLIIFVGIFVFIVHYRKNSDWTDKKRKEEEYEKTHKEGK